MNQKINMIRFNRPSQAQPSTDERSSVRANPNARKGKLQASHSQIPERCQNRICAFRRLFANEMPVLMN